MAKKNFCRFLALATITGAVAAGVSYFLKYRSFHAELEEDFHDFEEDESDFDGTLPHEGEPAPRNYVPLGEKKETTEAAKDDVEETDGTARETEDSAKEHMADTAEKAEETTQDMATTIVEDTPAD